MTRQEAEKRNPLFYLFEITWQYAKGNRRNIVIFWCMFIIANSFALLATPFLLGKIINTIQSQGITHENYWTLVQLTIASACIPLLFWCFHGKARVMENDNAFMVRTNYRESLLKGVMNLPMKWHSDNQSGATIDKIEKGTSALFEFSTNSFEVIKNIVRLIVSFGMIIYFCPLASFVIVGMIVVCVLITIWFDKMLIKQYKELNRSENEISAAIFDSISNISTVIILRVEKLIFQSIMEKVKQPFPLFRKNSISNEIKWFLSTVCTAILTMVVLCIYFRQQIGIEKGVLLGNIVMLTTYLEHMKDLFFEFTGLYGWILKRKAKVLNSEELTEYFQGESLENHVLPSDWQELAIRNLNFNYDDGVTVRHLDNVNLTIRRGERIAFIGGSGSGKTTCLHVMRDLYQPQNLKLSVDGTYIPDGFSGIARAIALVPQHPELFATTILENITLGENHEMSTVLQFTDMACFTHVAHSLPKKFNSSIKEKGVNLSGGEKQRLALARGLLACMDKDIVLLDEPTSSLDTLTEKKVYENILREFEGKTIISSIHKIHLLPLFDRICIFDNGQIVADGTFDELLVTHPPFAKAWSEYTRTENEVSLALA